MVYSKFKMVSVRSQVCEALGSDSDDDSVTYDQPTVLENTVVGVKTATGSCIKGYFLQGIKIDAGEGPSVVMLLELPNHGLNEVDRGQPVTVLFQGAEYFAIPTSCQARFLDSVVYLSTIPAGVADVVFHYDVADKGLSASSQVSVPLMREGLVSVIEVGLCQNLDAENARLAGNPFVFLSSHTDAAGRTYEVRYVNIQGPFEPGDSGSPVMIKAKPDYQLLGRLSYRDGDQFKVILSGQEAETMLFAPFVPTGDLRTAFIGLSKKKPFVPPTYTIQDSYTTNSSKTKIDRRWALVLDAFEKGVTDRKIGHSELYCRTTTTFLTAPIVKGHYEGGGFKVYLDAEVGSGTEWRATYTIDAKNHTLSFSKVFKEH